MCLARYHEKQVEDIAATFPSPITTGVRWRSFLLVHSMVYHAIINGMEEQHTKHVTYKIAFHFVWCPKYRKHLLIGDVAQFVEAEIRRLCEENGWPIDALTIQEDHVHLFLGAPPSVAPSLIANTLKGITARQVFKRYPEVKKQVWGGSFWSRSYYVGTVGDMTEETVKKYIELGQG